MHLTLFLSKAGVQMESEAVERMLDTRELGAGVGRNWGLEGCMRWREVVRSASILSFLPFLRSAPPGASVVFRLFVMLRA